MRPHGSSEPLSVSDRAAARDALTRLREGGDLVVTGKGGRIAIPLSIAREIGALLQACADGRTPLVAADDEEVGTQAAAQILGLSRPTVVKFMNEGRIPFRKPGKHRRVKLSDLAAFKARLERDRIAALETLAALGQEALESAREQGRLTDEMI